MDHFLYKNGQLFAEDVSLSSIADSVGTPFYCYSAATLTRHFLLFKEALDPMPNLVCFAVKSNSNIAVLKLLGDLGAGMDVVSIGEYLRAKAAGVPGDRIVFSGVGKTRDEMRLALEGGVRQFNVESEPEMEVLSQVASALGMVAPITLRVNPDVDAKTHEKISTGRKEDKFGVPISSAREIYARAAKLPGLKVIGVDMHIGSQITDHAMDLGLGAHVDTACRLIQYQQFGACVEPFGQHHLLLIAAGERAHGVGRCADLEPHRLDHGVDARAGAI